MAHTHAWQVNILTTGSICEIQICPAGTIVWLALINETHVRFFTVREVSFFMKHHPVQRKSFCIGFFYYGGTLYEQCILHVPGGTFADCRNRPGARSQRITSSGVPAKIRSQHLRPHRHRIHAKKDLGRIDRTHASHAPLRCHHHSGSQHHPLLYRRRIQLSRMRRHLCGHLPVGSHHHRYGRQKRQSLRSPQQDQRRHPDQSSARRRAPADPTERHRDR